MKTPGTRNVIRWAAAVGCAALATALTLTGGTPARADDAGPATMPTTRPAGRNVNAIVADFHKAMKQAIEATDDDKALTDPAKRAAVADKAIPPLAAAVACCDEVRDIAAKEPKYLGLSNQLGASRTEALAELYLLGDKPTIAKVDAMADGEDKVERAHGRSIRVLSQWDAAGADAAAQTKAVDELAKLDAEYPESVTLTMFTYRLSSQTGSDEVKEQLATLVGSMHNAAAARQKQEMAMQAAAVAKLKALSDKPMELTGKTVEGKDFTSADYKGKVVLVDFWATWCAPCKAELPHVRETYAQYHDQGLEIIGVSNDFVPADLTKFVAVNQMPWVELIDEGAAAENQWNPLSQGYGIQSIPRMFLIDKKGVCRSIDGYRDMGEMIPKLLAEK